LKECAARSLVERRGAGRLQPEAANRQTDPRWWNREILLPHTASSTKNETVLKILSIVNTPFLSENQQIFGTLLSLKMVLVKERFGSCYDTSRSGRR
jgi:hypothetical protein